MLDYATIQTLGLSRTAADAYQSLFNDGQASVQQLTARLKRPASSLYHALKQLEKLGFAKGLKTAIMPTYYRAIPLDKALENLAVYQRRTVARLLEEQSEIIIRRRVRVR